MSNPAQGAVGAETMTAGPDYWAIVALTQNGYEAMIVDQSPDCVSDDVLCNSACFTDNCDDMSWSTGQPMGLYRLRLGFFHLGDDDYDVTVISAEPLCQVALVSPRADSGERTAGDVERVMLADCPIGLFLAASGALCLKTEYGDNDGRIDAYIVESGEFFWGGSPQSIPSQRRQMVTPVPLEQIADAIHLPFKKMVYATPAQPAGAVPNGLKQEDLIPLIRSIASIYTRNNGSITDIKGLSNRLSREIVDHIQARSAGAVPDSLREAVATLNKATVLAEWSKAEREASAQSLAWVQTVVAGEARLEVCLTDSARALLREARDGLAAYTGGPDGACAETIARIDAILASHPAGQSARPAPCGYIECAALGKSSCEDCRETPRRAGQSAGSGAETFPKPRRKDGEPPCGECHLQPGETCDICGAVAPPASSGQGGRDEQS